MSDEQDELVRRASLGDATAVERLLERHLPDLERYVRRNIGASLLAKESGSDIVQSVCREALQSLDGFEYRGEAEFRAWLQQMALRKLVQRARYHGASKRGGEALAAAEFTLLASTLRSPSGDAVLREEIERLGAAFAKLPELDQRILRRVHLDGASHAEVARELGCTEVSSRKQLSRALARLSRLLD